MIVFQERENSDSSDWFGVVFSGLISSFSVSSLFSFSDPFSAFVPVVISSVSLFIAPVVSFV
ncbi:MAG: hypothetical protein K6E76_05215 [Patescibacteria group bacterium]|nr:hypothetical protein [Patescibacteria group bacterium]